MFSLTDQSLYVAALDLWIDSGRARERCYVSHGHADHARPHGTVVTSVDSARVCRQRFGRRGEERGVRFEEHAYNEPWGDGAHRMTLFSAGHVLGSSQLLIEGEAGAFVYTGDFKLGPAYTCEPAEVKKCDVLLMECTFGRAHYVFPPREEIEAQIAGFARRAYEDNFIPLFYAYTLGKAQEAMAILDRAGLPATVHPDIYAMARVYEDAGVQLGNFERYDAETYDGSRALLWTPNRRRRPKPPFRKLFRSAMLTGWALDPAARFRYGVDEMIPLSDHADFPSLLAYIERAAPSRVWLNHGYRDFTDELRRRGINAGYLDANEQLALF